MESEEVRLLLLQRFEHPGATGAKVAGPGIWWKINPENNCWEWLVELNHGGYAVLVDPKIHKRKRVRGHRLVYNLAKGDVPEGLVLDHLCRNRKCVNPEHLEIVTHKENTLRGNGPTARFSGRSHCVNGHAFSGENLLMLKDSKTGTLVRGCATCIKERRVKRSIRERKTKEAGNGTTFKSICRAALPKEEKS